MLREDDSHEIDNLEKGPADMPDVLPSASTTEGLAMRLLRPVVQDAEATEYASYVDQFRTLNLSNELSYESSAQDMKLYDRAIRLARDGGAGADASRIDNGSLELYEQHVRLIREQNLVARSSSGQTDASSTFSG